MYIQYSNFRVSVPPSTSVSREKTRIRSIAKLAFPSFNSLPPHPIPFGEGGICMRKEYSVEFHLAVIIVSSFGSNFFIRPLLTHRYTRGASYRRDTHPQVLFIPSTHTSLANNICACVCTGTSGSYSVAYISFPFSSPFPDPIPIFPHPPPPSSFLDSPFDFIRFDIINDQVDLSHACILA